MNRILCLLVVLVSQLALGLASGFAAASTPAAGHKPRSTLSAPECRARYESKDYAEAMRVCLQQSKQPEAQYYIGRMHEKGQGVSMSMTTARGWYEKAADANHPESQYRMAGAYRLGIGGVPKDEAKALDLLKRSAENGYPRAQKYLAEGYERGAAGLPQDKELARKWRERAAAPR